MKKQIISSTILVMIAFLFGLTGRVLATNQVDNREKETVENYVENTTWTENNIQAPGTDMEPPQAIDTNKNSEEYINTLNQELQNMMSRQQPKDNRKKVAITTIIIITVLFIVGLITWYYMTNQ